MKTAVLSLIAVAALACGGPRHGGDVTTTAPAGESPTMNDTAGDAPSQAAAPPLGSEQSERYDNSGFAGRKTDSMSPVAAATQPKPASAAVPQPASAQTATAPAPVQ